ADLVPNVVFVLLPSPSHAYLVRVGHIDCMQRAYLIDVLRIRLNVKLESVHVEVGRISEILVREVEVEPGHQVEVGVVLLPARMQLVRQLGVAACPTLMIRVRVDDYLLPFAGGREIVEVIEVPASSLGPAA